MSRLSNELARSWTGAVKMSRYLIVTADDMGYNVERNEGIIDSFKKKAVTNSSVIVNGVASQHAAQLALEHNLPTGIQFTTIIIF